MIKINVIKNYNKIVLTGMLSSALLLVGCQNQPTASLNGKIANSSSKIYKSVEDEFRYALLTLRLPYPGGSGEFGRSYLESITKKNINIKMRKGNKRSDGSVEWEILYADPSNPDDRYLGTISDYEIYLTKIQNFETTYDEAQHYCKNLQYNGYSNWSLPLYSSLTYLEEANFHKPYGLDSEIDTDDKYWLSEKATEIRYWYGRGNYKIYYSDIEKRSGFPDKWTFIKPKKTDKAKFVCVKKIPMQKTTYENFRVMISAGYYMGFNPEKSIYVVENRIGSLNELLYTKNIFPELQRITQALTDIYLEPRKISREPIPRDIIKPTAPEIPEYVKGEYETKQAFQSRVNQAIAKREETIKHLQQKYRQDVEHRNEIVKKLTDQYLAETEKIKIEQEYKKSILPQKIQEFQIAAFKAVTGGFEFEKRSYDPETQTMYLTMKAKRANFSKKVSLKVPLTQAKSFAENIKNVEAKVNFEFANNQITLKSINAVYDSANYIAVLDAKDFNPEKMVIVTKTKKVEFDSAEQMRLLLQNPNLKDTYQIEALAYKDGVKMKGSSVSYKDDIPSLLAKVSKT